MSESESKTKLGIMPYVAAIWAMSLYFTTPTAWTLTVWQLFNPRLSWLIILYLLYIWYGPGKHAAANMSWPTYLRHWSIWKALSKYFPVRLVKTAELDPSKRYIFGLHPHGVLTISAWATFASEGTNFSQTFPGINLRVATLRWNFITPIARELMLLLGFVDADAATLRRVLAAPGRGVMLAIGGAEEALLARPGLNDIVLNKRKGFVKIALQTGASLVPVYTFGENDVVTVVDTRKVGWARSFQRGLKKVTGFTLPFVYGRGLFGVPVGMLPHRVPLTSVVGAPIPVPKFNGDLKSEEGQKLVDEYHARYIAGLKAVWEQHKDKYAPKRRKSLDIVQ
ncbi:Diacylglycerol O-acyltransferase 2 [Coccomyxa sp. Obi]|nr:type-2 diacylglycerol acyltransferase [Coccomyxa sp. Obi]BDA43207.1 Diacylglycerol O-acyltransferase 2 [Coccomyxa sp. Obi]